MSDVLADTAAALIRAGLDASRVKEVIRDQRARWGGAAVYVRATDPGERESKVRDAIARGLSARGAAAAAGCSDDTVRRILARGMGCEAGMG